MIGDGVLDVVFQMATSAEGCELIISLTSVSHADTVELDLDAWGSSVACTEDFWLLLKCPEIK